MLGGGEGKEKFNLTSQLERENGESPSSFRQFLHRLNPAIDIQSNNPQEGEDKRKEWKTESDSPLICSNNYTQAFLFTAF